MMMIELDELGANENVMHFLPYYTENLLQGKII